ncbi:MAG TPA: hypothetical protein IAC37_11660 [Candidatus Ventrimonas merdavium]|nr:hypothetical protein [Candidatus Ventrimonas merdavium]
MSEEHNTQNPAAGDAEAISQALAQEIVNVTSPLPKVDLTDLSQEPPLASASVSSWFITFMCMNLPFVGWIYLLRLAFRKDRTERQNFARAYLFYKLVFLGVSALILGILIWIGLDILDQLLAYMEML